MGRAWRRSDCGRERSVERLNPNQVIVVIDVPDRYRFGRSVNNRSAIVCIRFRHLIDAPHAGFGIKSNHLPAVKDACPDLAVLVRISFVEIGVWMWRSGRPELLDPLRLRIQLDQRAIRSAPPGIPERIEAASLGRHEMRAAI